MLWSRTKLEAGRPSNQRNAMSREEPVDVRRLQSSGEHGASKVVTRVLIDGCDAKHRMSVQMMYPCCDDVDGLGAEGAFVRDAVWRLSVHGAPHRYTRLSNGELSLRTLLTKYSFADDKGCAYTLDPERAALQNLQHNARKIGEFGVDPGVVDAGRKSAATPRRATRWFVSDRKSVFGSVAAHPKGGGDADSGESIGTCHFTKRGVAQLTERSGICWYSAMWYALLCPPSLNATLLRHVNSRRAQCKDCDFLADKLDDILFSQSQSECVRRHLYEHMSIGDKPGQPGHLDGQNGASMATMLLHRLGLRVATVVAPWMRSIELSIRDAHEHEVKVPAVRESETAPDILLVRTYRTRWDAPQRLRWPPGSEQDDERGEYELVSACIGSEFCHHQTAIARSCEPCTWSFSDSDSIRCGIHPICFRVAPRKSTRASWSRTIARLLPTTNATSDTNFCDMAPGGRHPLAAVKEALDAQGLGEYMRNVNTDSTEHDLINVDYFYVHDPIKE